MKWAVVLFAGAVVSGQTPGADSCAELEREANAQRRLLNDWAGLVRYGSDNAEVKLRPDENRVVFLGDEITERWGTGSEKFFPGKPYFNRGIAHQTTPQMLVRFRQDVISLKPKVVVILAGSNDLGGLAGPITQNVAAENFMSMAELAKANGIRVVLASVTPVCNCTGQNWAARRSTGKILGMNEWLKTYAAEIGAVYLDYYAALVQGRAMNKNLTVDGLVPNDEGYRIMASLAEKAISTALAGK
jgi:lysophospholipase L1-like esterase